MDRASNSGSRDYRHREGTSHSHSHSHTRSRSRSRSPDRRRHRHHRHHHDHHRHKSHGHSRHEDKRSRDHSHSHDQPKVLPFQARQLSKRDLPIYQPALAMYLDIQKGLWIDDLSEEEVKGRWKSFVSKWYDILCSFLEDTWMVKKLILIIIRNRGELAEGWYDPGILKKARDAQDQGQGQGQGQDQAQDRGRDTGRSQNRTSPEYNTGERDEEDDGDDEEDYGPDLPQQYKNQVNRHGPSIPTTQDLELRKGTYLLPF